MPGYWLITFSRSRGRRVDYWCWPPGVNAGSTVLEGSDYDTYFDIEVFACRHRVVLKLLIPSHWCLRAPILHGVDKYGSFHWAIATIIEHSLRILITIMFVPGRSSPNADGADRCKECQASEPWGVDDAKYPSKYLPRDMASGDQQHVLYANTRKSHPWVSNGTRHTLQAIEECQEAFKSKASIGISAMVGAPSRLNLRNFLIYETLEGPNTSSKPNAVVSFEPDLLAPFPCWPVLVCIEWLVQLTILATAPTSG